MKISAALLVGGESRRMGSDKATVLFDGEPLWRVQLSLLRKLRPSELIVSGRADPPWRPLDVQFVPDDPPSRGPMSGLAASLARIRTTHLLVLAVDMPFMNEKYLRSLCDQIEPARGVVPMIDRQAEPMAAIYPVQIHAGLVDALSRSDFSLQSLIKGLVAAGKLKAVRVSREKEQLFRNLNEPADLS